MTTSNDTSLSAVKEETHLESSRSWETIDTIESSYVDMMSLECCHGETTGASKRHQKYITTRMKLLY